MLDLQTKAQPHLEKVVELRQQVDGPEHESVARALVNHAWTLEDLKRYVEAETQLRKALEIYRRRGVQGYQLLNAMSALQKLLLDLDRDDEAKRVMDEAIAIADSSKSDNYEVAIMMMRYANLKISQGEFAEAEQLARRSIEMQRALPGNFSLSGAHGFLTLSKALQAQQKLDEAEQAARESLAIFRRRYAPAHKAVRNATGQLKSVLSSRGDQPGLEAIAREEAELTTRSGGPEYRVRLAGMLLMNNPRDSQQEEARRLIRWALDEYAQKAVKYADNFNQRLTVVTGYLDLLKICSANPGFADEREEVSRRMMDELPQLAFIAKRITNPNELADALYYVAVAQARVGDAAGYRATCQALIELPLDKLEGLTKSRPIWTPCIAPNSLPDPNLPLQIAERFLADRPISDPQFDAFMLGAAHYRIGHYEQAVKQLEESIAAFSKDATVITNSINYPRLFLAMSQWQLGKKDEARRFLAETLPNVEQELESPASGWNRRATLELLRDEATALIGDDETNAAQDEDESPAADP
jgi:tetratricopeptide (TPR) repeat protein